MLQVHNHLLRYTHQTATAINLDKHQIVHQQYVAILVVSLLALLVITFFFIKNTTSGLFQLPISPTQKQQKIVFGIIITLLAGIGIYALFFGNWSTPTWVFIGMVNLLLAAFIYSYQSDKEYTLIVSSIFIVLTSIFSILLAQGINRDNPQSGILNLVGIIEGWSTVWALYVLNQYWFYSYRVAQKKQNIVFFITAISITIILTLSKIFLTKLSFVNIIGLILVNCILLGLMYWRQREVYQTGY